VATLLSNASVESIGNECIIVSGLLQQSPVNALKDGYKIGAGAAAGVEDADVRRGTAQRCRRRLARWFHDATLPWSDVI
jgi:hypothetical protein